MITTLALVDRLEAESTISFYSDRCVASDWIGIPNFPHRISFTVLLACLLLVWRKFPGEDDPKHRHRQSNIAFSAIWG